MTVYLPIAEMPINALLLIGLGGAVGMMSGMFGVGGGFLMTPFLIFMGIPPAVAVGTEATQILASSVSGALAHWKRGHVDLIMGGFLVGGGFVGSSLGIWAFAALRESGQIDLFIQIAYVLMLCIIGSLMMTESLNTIRKTRRQTASRKKMRPPLIIRILPFKMRFRHSHSYVSPIAPFAIGILVGLLAALMGIGGGFIMIPAMIYILGMSPTVVVGTSLFQIVFVTANTAFLQAAVNHTVDIVLALLLIAGGVIGAQVGARFAGRIRSDYFRLILAALVLVIAVKLLFDSVTPPEFLYQIEALSE